ncbi:hypothetical protein J6590_039431 [Homalodisca vitripennis]|nr:hypothetical protein J6590_039431 [Homalodisca vitripennis]
MQRPALQRRMYADTHPTICSSCYNLFKGMLSTSMLWSLNASETTKTKWNVLKTEQRPALQRRMYADTHPTICSSCYNLFKGMLSTSMLWSLNASETTKTKWNVLKTEQRPALQRRVYADTHPTICSSCYNLFKGMLSTSMLWSLNASETTKTKWNVLKTEQRPALQRRVYADTHPTICSSCYNLFKGMLSTSMLWSLNASETTKTKWNVLKTEQRPALQRRITTAVYADTHPTICSSCYNLFKGMLSTSMLWSLNASETTKTKWNVLKTEQRRRM